MLIVEIASDAVATEMAGARPLATKGGAVNRYPFPIFIDAREAQFLRDITIGIGVVLLDFIAIQPEHSGAAAGAMRRHRPHSIVEVDGFIERLRHARPPFAK
jgi:hypothetical protein